MKIGIMQPYFFPYIGYFSLIKHTDEFMLFDPVQFIHHGWIERNRILKPINKSKPAVQGENWQYISVPLLAHARETTIKDIRINNSIDWREKIKSQLICYKKRAPYYSKVMEIVEEGLNIKTDSIVELNLNILKTICKYLNINTKLTVFSKEKLNIIHPKAPDEWALNICIAKQCIKEYINPPGGMSFFDEKKYLLNGIELSFLKNNLKPYVQRIGYFESGLSIIDVMMFNDVEKINEMLDDYEILKKSSTIDDLKKERNDVL